MALKVGDLVADLKLDPSKFEKGLDDSEKSAKKSGGNFSSIFALAGTGAALAFGAAMLSGLDQGSVGAKVAAQLGQGSKEAAKYGKIAGELYADNWGASMASLGEALTAIQRANLIDPSDTEGLKELTKQASILADTFGLDVQMSINAVGNMIRNGLVPDAKTAFDLIAAGAQHGVDKAGDLVETFNEYSTQFRDLGLTGAQAMGLLSQGLLAGARDADTVADALKEFAIRAQDGSTTSAAGFKAIGLNAKQMTKVFAAGGPAAAAGLDQVLDRLRAMKDPVARNAAAVALFGTKAEDLQNSLFALDPSAATAALGDFANAADKAGDMASNTAAGKMAALKREVTATATAFGASLAPELMKAVGWIKDNQSWVSKLAIGIAALAAVVVTISAAQKAWTAIQAAWTVVTGAATAAQWLWNVAMMANPIGLIILAVIALIAVIVLIATKTTWFQDLWKWAWTGIKAAAQAVADWFTGTIVPSLKKAFDQIVGALTWLRNGFMSIFTTIGSIIIGAFNYAVSVARGAINNLIGLVNTAINGINSVIRAANHIPGVNINTMQNIPRLAGGGVVSPRPGGTPVIMGDGGEVEYGIPRSQLESMLARAAGGGSGGTVHVVISGTGILRGVRGTARVQGGSAQTVLVGG
jgi:hypothetical protein